jgi:5-methylcytosine-specific restriction protein A
MTIINKNIRKYEKRVHTDKKHNPNNQAVYNTRTWKILRLNWLAENPLCTRCKKNGILVSAVEVHHIIPISSGKDLGEKQALGFNVDNLESLCNSCHKHHHKFKTD